MIEYGQAVPLQEAVRSLSERAPVASAMRSAEWARADQEIRDRSFFISRVEDERFLAVAQAKLMQRLKLERRNMGEGATMDRARFIKEMSELAREVGISSGDGSLTDLGSERRLGLVWDMQVAFAEGFAKHKMGLEPAILDAAPAQELVRVEDRVEKRNWRARWVEAEGTLTYLNDDGTPLEEDPESEESTGRMVALKTDPIWVKISAFGLPYPPFDWGSGMGLKTVRRRAAEALGLIGRDEIPAPPEAPARLNEGLEASAAGIGEEGRRRLKDTFGDYAEFEGDRILWDFARSEAEAPELKALPVTSRLAARRTAVLATAGAAPYPAPGNPDWGQLTGRAAEVSTGQMPSAREYFENRKAGEAAAARLRDALPADTAVSYDPETGWLWVTKSKSKKEGKDG
jgi:hypothetical protein